MWYVYDKSTTVIQRHEKSDEVISGREQHHSANCKECEWINLSLDFASL